jgi:hypothetical protein
LRPAGKPDGRSLRTRQVLTEKNPCTGIPLAQDPALAIVEIQNEDSLLFWTSQAIKGSAKQELRRQFGEFLRKKYDSLAKAAAAWNGAAPSPDQDGPELEDQIGPSQWPPGPGSCFLRSRTLDDRAE